MKAIVIFAILLFTTNPLAANPSIFLVGDINDTYTGTAFELYTKTGNVTITNAHICDKNTILLARLINPDRFKILVVKKVYPKHDLCELSGIPGLSPLFLAEDYQLGESVKVEGFPLGVHAISLGKVGRYIRLDRNRVVTEYTGQTNFGNSGSPVTNNQGLVIGIIAVKTGDGKGGMVPLENIKDFLDMP